MPPPRTRIKPTITTSRRPLGHIPALSSTITTNTPLVAPAQSRTATQCLRPTPSPHYYRPSPSHTSIRHASSSSSSLPMPPAPSSRWLSDLLARVGKCIIFGCEPTQISRAAGVLRAVATEWRGLAAGSEGFLTGGRRGMEGQQVVWGEQDSFVSKLSCFFFIRELARSRNELVANKQLTNW